MFGDYTGSELILIFGSIILSMGFHEAMHGFTAHWLGDDTAHNEGRLTLNPLKHIDLVTTILLPLVLILAGAPPFFIAKPVPFNPARVKYDEFGVALIGIAGPLTNSVLAGIAALIVRAGGIAVGTELFQAFSIFIQVNIGFFVFNLIPFPPLDGSRVLYAFAPEPVQDIMRRVEAFGFMGIILFMIVLYQFISPFISSISEAIYLFLLA
jgi:Zn-dependent protease